MDDHQLMVTLEQGKLKGQKRVSPFSQKIYYTFSGIPYAKPPVGKLRFKPPVEAEKWKGILDATKERNDCLQYSFFRHQIIGDEDCLYLNIHTPEVPCKIIEPKAVIINIHQGAYNCGSGSVKEHGSPDYIIHQDVIYVTFNYRLHVFGFLNLGIKECAGNAGLKDMVMAMKWVQRNISTFGGDPTNVTVYSSSSGASAAHILMCLPQTKGLFHKCIMQGSYALVDACGYHENAEEIAIEYAKFLGCRTSNPRLIYKHLMAANQYDLLRAQSDVRAKLILENPGKYSMTPFFPSIEKPSEHAILTENPKKFIENAEPMPILFGICEHEATLMFYNYHINAVKEDLFNVLKKNLWQYKIDDETVAIITNKVKNFYFEKDSTIDVFSLEVEKFFMDLWYCELYPSMIDIIAKKQTVPALYLYQFTFDGELNFQKKVFLPKLFCSPEKLKGPCHADDSYYWMGGFFRVAPRREARMIEKMGRLWTNFAKTGNPNDSGENVEDCYWKPYTIDEPCYLILDEVNKMKNGKYNEERQKLWDEIRTLIYECESKNL